MNVGEGCEAAATERTRWWWVKHRECGELLHGMIFHLKLKGGAHKSHARPTILYGSEAWCLKERGCS